MKKENSSGQLIWGFLALCSKYFPQKEETDFKAKESCLQNSCKYVNICALWWDGREWWLCGLKSQQTSERVKCYKTSVTFLQDDILGIFVNGFESQRAKSSKKAKCWHVYSNAFSCPM